MVSRTNRILIIFIIINLLIYIPRSSLGEAVSIIIEEGHQHFMGTKELTRIAIGNPEIVGVSSINGGSGILIAGKKKGTTDILVWEKKTVKKVIVNVIDNTLSKDRLNDSELLSVLVHLGVRTPKISRYGDMKIVTGSGNDVAVDSAKIFLSRFEAIIPAIKNDYSMEKEIVFELNFMEVSKGGLTSLGVDWPDGTEVNAQFTKDREKSLVVDSSLSLVVRHLLSEGKARILASPILICKEGESASFHAGGEIPVVIISDENREVIWKQYGIILNLHNRVESGDVIVTRVEAEVSTLDHSTGTSDIPGMITRRVDTSFQIISGKTIVLSGLVKNDTIKDVTKFPFLGEVPILGELFKSRNFRKNYSELIITITPTFAGDFDSESLSGKFHEKFREMGKELKFNLMD